MNRWVLALLWKESRESGVAIAISVLLTITLAGLAKTVEASGMPANALELVPVLWPFFALCAASPTFAGEARDGTLGFLASLPVSRTALWNVKTAAVLLRWLMMIAVSLAVWALLCPLLLGRPPQFELYSAERILRSEVGPTGLEQREYLRYHLLPLPPFGLGLGAAILGATVLFSTLMESATIAAVAGFALVSAAAATLHRFALEPLLRLGFNPWLLGAGFLPAALWGSQAAFTAGDLRPGRAKLAAAGRVLLFASIPVLAGVFAVLIRHRL
jgi:hypothetical protein